MARMKIRIGHVGSYNAAKMARSKGYSTRARWIFDAFLHIREYDRASIPRHAYII